MSRGRKAVDLVSPKKKVYIYLFRVFIKNKTFQYLSTAITVCPERIIKTSSK